MVDAPDRAGGAVSALFAAPTIGLALVVALAARRARRWSTHRRLATLRRPSDSWVRPSVAGRVLVEPAAGQRAASSPTRPPGPPRPQAREEAQSRARPQARRQARPHSPSRLTRRRLDRLASAALPETLDLLRVAIGSGLAPAQALAEIVADGPVPATSRLRPVLDLSRSGLSFTEACTRVAAGDPVVAEVVTLLGDGTRTGAALGEALERLADERAAAHRRRAEERARAVPVKLLFPLVCCTLPGFVLLAVVPALIRAFQY
jgi:Type II secretion system (T2SS), protein F